VDEQQGHRSHVEAIGRIAEIMGAGFDVEAARVAAPN
jgi:hypothetical protein